MTEPLPRQASRTGCRRCADCVHFDGAPGVNDAFGDCHDPRSPAPRATHGAESCDGFLAVTTIAWRQTTQIIYGRPPGRRPADRGCRPAPLGTPAQAAVPQASVRKRSTPRRAAVAIPA